MSNKSSVNKSLFEFNETFVDSIIQSQPHKNKSIRIDQSIQEEENQETAIVKEDKLPSCLKPQELVDTCENMPSQRTTNLMNEIDSLKGLVLENTPTSDDKSDKKLVIDSKMSIQSPNLKTLKTKQSTLSQNANLLREINSLEGLMLDTQINDEKFVQVEDSFQNGKVINRDTSVNIQIDDSLQNESIQIW